MGAAGHDRILTPTLDSLRADNDKLIWYPGGNLLQLFDLDADPHEMLDLAADPDHAPAVQRLTTLLISELYGADLDWVQDGQLVGVPAPDFQPQPNRGLVGQRGWR